MVLATVCRCACVAVVVAVLAHLQSTPLGRTGSKSESLAERVRRPVALAIAQDGKWLYVANRRSGSISVIDI